MDPEGPARTGFTRRCAASEHHRYDTGVLTAILLVFVAAAGPWVIQLAPRRQRLLALVGFVAVLLLWLLFENWFGKWYFWLALAGGIVSVLWWNGHDTHRPPREREPYGGDLTEEF